MTRATFTCPKCSGKGFISGFDHIADGRCFACAGSGVMSAKAEVQADPHPHKLVPVEQRATQRQWDYLMKLVRNSDREFCKVVASVGGEATMRYLDRRTMSKAIETARAGA